MIEDNGSVRLEALANHPPQGDVAQHGKRRRGLVVACKLRVTVLFGVRFLLRRAAADVSVLTFEPNLTDILVAGVRAAVIPEARHKIGAVFIQCKRVSKVASQRELPPKSSYSPKDHNTGVGVDPW